MSAEITLRPWEQPTAVRLWELLPAIYRIRDEEMATQARTDIGPLRALLTVVAEQVAVLEEDLEQLYDDQFIETCAEWVVPYIGDLVSARGIAAIEGARFSSRAQVADTIRMRRRKGTLSMIEQLARDVTLWDATVVEYFQLLATTQYMNHIRPANLSFASLRMRDLLDANTPFDRTAHTLDVRSIERGVERGMARYNIPNIGIHLWRIDAFPSTKAVAYQADPNDARRFLFDPLGRDIPLFRNSPVSRPLGRRALAKDFDTLYGTDLLVEYTPSGGGPPVSSPAAVCDLSGDPVWAHDAQPGKITIDPELGRIALPEDATRVEVTYLYGFSDEIGGGEYDRLSTFDNSGAAIISVPDDEPTLADALAAVQGAWGSATKFVIELTRNDYHFSALTIDIPEGKTLEIRGANTRRPIVVIDGVASITGETGSQLIFNGTIVAGDPIVVPATDGGGDENELSLLRFVHCTLPPRQPDRIGPWSPAGAQDVRVTIEASNCRLEIDSSITGAIRTTDEAEANVHRSIIDAGGESELAYGAASGFGAPLTIRNSTVIGRVETRLMHLASNVIFHATNVNAEQIQKGCVRFSYVPVGSHVPRRFRCVPSDEAPGVRPAFTSTTFGDPAYCQLARNCAEEIRAGGDDGAEMGVFHDLYQPQREANLRARLDEFLRFGLEAGVFYAS